MRKKIEFFIILILLCIFVYVGRAKVAIFFHNQGASFYDRGLYGEAIASFKKSLEINPVVAVVHYNLANAYMEKDMLNEAIEEYKKTIQIAPQEIRTYKALSHIYSSQGMYLEALNLLKEAELLVPSSLEIKELSDNVSFEYITDALNKSTELFLSGDKKKAIDILNRAIEINPEFAFAHYTLAYFYFTEQNYDAAGSSLNRAIEIEPEFWPAYKLLGDIYFDKGMYEKAITSYKAALKFNYNDSTIYNDLGLALMQMERYNEAMIYVGEALKLDEENLNIRYSLASLYRDNGMFDEAVAEYKRLIEHQPDYPHAHNDLADIYRNQGKHKEAFEEYNKEISYAQTNLTTDPDNPVLLNNLSYAFCGIGEYDKAKKIIDKVLTLRPKYRQGYLTLANIYENLGNLKAASEALVKAKALSAETSYIDKGISQLKKDISLSDKKGLLPLDTIYLKNGRRIEGRIIEEDGEKVILEVDMGETIGNLIFYRKAIKEISKCIRR